MNWNPSLGAWPEENGVRFRVWAPKAKNVEVFLGTGSVHPMASSSDGVFETLLPGLKPGTRYKYKLEGIGSFPDPASRFQPDGVHDFSEVVDPRLFSWSDAGWNGRLLEGLVLYEIHVGTFSTSGDFAGVAEKLPELAELGVNAIELMPLADFPGDRNWGYDGVSLFAPARCYGSPGDLRRLVDKAHALGLAVILDVVYNHLGPDGNYLGVYSPHYFTSRHKTPWGNAINFNGEGSKMVREFFIENAHHWIHEYHMDGLRLDATHAIIDAGQRHFLAELGERVRASAEGRHVLLIAEDHRNLNTLLRSASDGGWGLDAVWADDFHHQVRRCLAGDSEGYYRDFSGSVPDIAETLHHGWFFRGQVSEQLDESRGSDSSGIPAGRFVICLQNHDQIGNRALGERLHTQIDPAAYRAASTLLLCAPQTPLLFMGQEWAASNPFLYFTDHEEELGRLVTEGRRDEFKHFSDFRDPEKRTRIPNPQAISTFQASRLNWEEKRMEAHASILRLYRALLNLRKTEPALHRNMLAGHCASAPGGRYLLLVRTANAEELWVAIQLKGSGSANLEPENTPGKKSVLEDPDTFSWEKILDTEEAAFCIDPMPPELDLSGAWPIIEFRRPGAVILRRQNRKEEYQL